MFTLVITDNPEGYSVFQIRPRVGGGTFNASLILASYTPRVEGDYFNNRSETQ